MGGDDNRDAEPLLPNVIRLEALQKEQSHIGDPGRLGDVSQTSTQTNKNTWGRAGGRPHVFFVCLCACLTHVTQPPGVPDV